VFVVIVLASIGLLNVVVTTVPVPTPVAPAAGFTDVTVGGADPALASKTTSTQELVELNVEVGNPLAPYR
jgi:hypothetical protein